MTARTKGVGWKRHLEGWQAGAIILLLAGSAIILSTPRGAIPVTPPAPSVDNAAVAAIMTADDQWAIGATARPLDVDVRAVGDQIRAYNVAASQKDEAGVQDARARLLEASQKALVRSKEELLMLRAYHTKRFVEELRQWQRDGAASDELAALSGDFVDTLARNAWCVSERELLMTEPELRVLFKKRWNDITGLRGPSFDLSVDEDRMRFGFLLRHPFRDQRSAPEGSRIAIAQRANAQMAVIEKLVTLDPGYPVDIARGVVLFQQQRFAAAGEHFRRHLAAHPDGPHTLRVRNYLKAALDLAAETL